MQGEAGKIRVVRSDQIRLVSITWILTLQNPLTRPLHQPDSCTATMADRPGQPAITGLPTIQVTISANPATITDYASFPGKGSIVIDPNSPKRLLIGLATFFDNVNNI